MAVKIRADFPNGSEAIERKPMIREIAQAVFSHELLFQPRFERDT
jgi:hypothetical protein